jgi:hypothetical protein
MAGSCQTGIARSRSIARSADHRGRVFTRAVSQLDLTQEGHKGHEDKSFEQEEMEAAAVKIKKRSLVEPRCLPFTC